MSEKTAYLPYKVKDIALADWGRKEIDLAEIWHRDGHYAETLQHSDSRD